MSSGTRVYISLSPKYKNRVEGLCGNYNNDGNDDLSSVVAANPQEFGNMYATSGSCPHLGPEDAPGEACEVNQYNSLIVSTTVLSSQ